MLREYVIVDDGGEVHAVVVANTATGGATITPSQSWHGPALLDRYAQTLNEAALWLRLHEQDL